MTSYNFKGRTIDGRLVEDVKLLIGQKNSDALANLIAQMRAADLADLIMHLDAGERLYIIQMMEPEGAGEVLIELEQPVQVSILKDLDNQSLSQIVEELNSDDAADLVGDLPAERAREVMEAVDDQVSEELEKLLPYADDTAGGIMALEFLSVKEDATVMDAIESIREKGKEIENLYSIWVTDDYGRLVGVISLKDLVLAKPETQIRKIMNPEIISVDVKTDQEEVARLVMRYDLVNVPVVDNYNRLVGRITNDDIMDVIEEEADEDISLMAGVFDQDIMEESAMRISRARLPWLVAALFGGLFAALVIRRFAASLEQMIALSFFFPVVMAMGGNTGNQAATLVVRGLATGDITFVNIGKRLWMELRVALVNGLICGGILGIVVGFWLGDFRLGAMIAMALVFIILISGIIGSAVPLALHRLNVDPALAAGPFVSTSNDILGLLIYLAIVTAFLRSI